MDIVLIPDILLFSVKGHLHDEFRPLRQDKDTDIIGNTCDYRAAYLDPVSFAAFFIAVKGCEAVGIHCPYIGSFILFKTGFLKISLLFLLNTDPSDFILRTPKGLVAAFKEKPYLFGNTLKFRQSSFRDRFRLPRFWK